MSAKETQVVIAEGPYGSVAICRCCEIVHVTVGALTLRVEPQVLFSIWGTLGEAVQRLGGVPVKETQLPC